MPLDDAVNEPTEGQGGDSPESQDSGKSTRNQRAAKTRGYVAQLANNVNELQGRLGRIEGMLEGLSKNSPQGDDTGDRDPADPWGQMSDDKLAEFLNNEQMIQEKPHLVPHATLKLAERMTKREIAKLRGEMEDTRQVAANEVNTQLQTYSGTQEWTQMAISDFGEDVRNPESDLFLAADAQYRAFEAKYGKDEVARQPELIYTAVRRAAKQLGMSPKTSDAAPQTESIQTTGGETSPEDLGLGVSDAEATRQAGEEVQALLDKEDFRGAAKRLVSQIGYPD